MILASILPLIIGVVVLIVGGVAAYYIVRAGKGSLELHLPTTGVDSGERITGTVTLTTKKALEARRFFVALVGREEIERRDNSEDGKRTETREIYRNEYSFLDGEQLPAGMNQGYDFELIAPGRDNIDRGGDEISGGFQLDLGGLTIGNDQRRRLKWAVEARLDLPGVDLAKSKSVRVNLS
jgi:hypothetical protein